MPQQDILPLSTFQTTSNVDFFNAVRNVSTQDFQNRVPPATKASIQSVVENMWNYSPNRNQFADALVNAVGLTIMRTLVWQNPMKRFKRGQLAFGETIEEVAFGLLKANRYSTETDYLEQTIFGKVPSEVQSRFHRIDRQEFYKATINRTILRRAFENENGLATFAINLMNELQSSDEYDEFLQMTSLFSTWYNEGGYFSVNTNSITDPTITGTTAQANAQMFLVAVREMVANVQFPTRKYNPARMPVAARPEDLHLFLTPRGQALIDVDALSAAFHVDKAAVLTDRTTIVPSDYMTIPNFQGLLTTKDFFIVADTHMELQTVVNPAGLHQNVFWHHHEILSASTFQPAILFTTDQGTVVTLNATPVSGMSAVVLTDGNGTTITQLVRGGLHEVLVTATTTPAGGPNNGVTFSLIGQTSVRTKILQTGTLYIAPDEAASSITVRAQSTSDPSFYVEVAYTVTGSLLEAGVQSVMDDNTTVIHNTALPRLTPTAGAVGQVFTADPGKWDVDNITPAYQWYANGTAISGATADTYTAVAGNVGQTLTCTVTVTKTGLTAGVATSRATSAVTAS